MVDGDVDIFDKEDNEHQKKFQCHRSQYTVSFFHSAIRKTIIFMFVLRTEYFDKDLKWHKQCKIVMKHVKFLLTSQTLPYLATPVRQNLKQTSNGHSRKLYHFPSKHFYVAFFMLRKWYVELPRMALNNTDVPLKVFSPLCSFSCASFLCASFSVLPCQQSFRFSICPRLRHIS